MTAVTPFPPEPTPYKWVDKAPPSPDILRLWTEVGNGIDKSQTVVWKSAVESLDAANQFIRSSEDARRFVENYMQSIISILVEQQPTKIGPHERNCVQESLMLATIIISRDLDIQLQRHGESNALNVLSLVFNKKKAYYKGNKGNWNNHMSGLPEVRLKMIEKFRQEHGFSRLHRYLMERINTPLFPSLDLMHQVLTALVDVIPQRNPNAEQPVAIKEVEDAAIDVATAAMHYINSCSDEALKKIPTDQLNVIQHDIQRIFDKLIVTRRESTYDFYKFWRGLVLRLIKSPSLPLQLFGWQQIDDLLDACAEHRPPPRAFEVSTAGCTFVNGTYQFTGSSTDDGYAQQGMDISYERRIPDDVEDGGGKKLTLFRCTMRSQQKWWFLSEADEEQPGTDRDIDYYQHKSKEHEETQPPPYGWVTCRNSGVDPPPRLSPVGLMVPPGQEFNTLEHQLAQWAIQNGIVELVLGDSLHREIVSRSTALIKFLASMCERDAGVESASDTPPNLYCLRSSHLQLAWKTCLRKTDSAVSDQVYMLLVSILPSCPDNLAIPLLRSVRDSLYNRKERGEYLNEVADFCDALARANSSDAKSASTLDLSDNVRTEVLQLLWSVLTHPDAAGLKNYDALKQYVTNELRVEPKGKEHRERYLESCVETLTTNSKLQGSEPVDEVQALRMVNLTHFVLEACPRAQAAELVLRNSGALPALLFDELTAFLKRRGRRTPSPAVLRKSPSMESETKQDANNLSERLHILRYVYGVSNEIFMSSPQLDTLWQLCSAPQDREEAMIFIANASNAEQASPAMPAPVTNQQPQPQPQTNRLPQEEVLSAAFAEDVCSATFLNLFCSTKNSFQQLGEGAYHSFQSLYNKMRLSPSYGPTATPAAIDALWRICLGAKNNSVASKAMTDLLQVYITFGGVGGQSDQMDIESSGESFGKRVFDCLESAKRGMRAQDAASELAAERCLRILNAAIGQDEAANSISSSTLGRLTALSPNAVLNDAMVQLPHGMQGHECYRRVGVMVKRTQNNQNVQNPQPNDRDMRNPSTSRFTLDLHPLETLASIKRKVALFFDCPVSFVKPISASGRQASSNIRTQGPDSTQLSLNVVPDDSIVDHLGIVQGCEMVFVIADRQTPQAPNANAVKQSNPVSSSDLSAIFCNDIQFAGKLFLTLLGILESLSTSTGSTPGNSSPTRSDVQKLAWDLLLAMPTNLEVASQVLAPAQTEGSSIVEGDAMEIDHKQAVQWSKLLDLKSFHRSVYVLLAIDSLLQPALEVLSILPDGQREIFERQMKEKAVAFRQGFINSGGFDAVVHFFAATDSRLGMSQSMTRMGNAVALRILKCCLFGSATLQETGNTSSTLDESGTRLLQSLSEEQGLLKSLTSMVVEDSGISTTTISDVLKFLRLLFKSPRTAQTFVALPGGMAERFLVTLLLWEGESDKDRPSSTASSSSKVRKSTHDLISGTPFLTEHALPWLIGAIDSIQVSSESTSEFFDILKRLVSDDKASHAKGIGAGLNRLATAVCKKLASCPRPTSETAMVDFSTGVLCGCLALLRAIIEKEGGGILRDGTSILIKEFKVMRWSEEVGSPNKGMFSKVSPFRSKAKKEDLALIDLMGVVFDAFLSPGGSSSVVAICCDKESRQRGFDVVGAAARSCSGSDGYIALVSRINNLISSASPFLKHRWGQLARSSESHSRNGKNTSKYSGLRNQGCTCYMNSVLQQLFMMPELRNSMCAAPLPASVRSSGGAVSSKGVDLVGKKVSMQWDNGISYDAIVENFNNESGMHTIRYCPMPVATVGGASHQQIQPDDIARLPPLLPEEFRLSEGRPGKETGLFEIVESRESLNQGQMAVDQNQEVEETEDEATSRHLMEEVQRTFIHLDEGSRGRCFDPRALVEACACLKLEFDVWQQNDASEFATKLLDRLETSLKRWAPDHFRYLDHTFGLKQTKQKICKECGLKTNREEKLLNVDCQIRGKSDIHEALGSMTEVEIMEGSNQVFCDRCKKNTDTILRTALSTLPNMLILSLKRFDLDYNTFETVKLNSRCAFDETLNMKQYTLEGLEAMEQAKKEAGPDDMDTGTDDSPLGQLPDEDYEYKLAGVLVHAGVAQGGHYYSFIKDRSPGSEEKWYRFDDEDVTPFDAAQIEAECFGGKVKKETKWPNGQVHTVESEQYANALMLFYEKVKPTATPPPTKEEKKENKKVSIPKDLVMTSGYDVFEPDVKRSNATHRWQTFLFDAEFQIFLKGLLGLCRMSSFDDANQRRIGDAVSERLDSTWRGTVLQMLLTFVFDVLLYASERHALGDWVRMLEETMKADTQCARAFVAKVASRTKEVSSNWLRTYLADCPDHVARTAAVRIFTAAFESCLSRKEEQEKLKSWTHAWIDQMKAIGPIQRPVPCTLEKKEALLEDIKSEESSVLGVILSFVNVLIEASPRNWRFSPELCLFVRNLASLDRHFGGSIVRNAMIESLIPARLICLVVREHAPATMRVAFPGSSVSTEVAETQIRPEANPAPPMMSMAGNHVMNPPEVNYRGGSPMDFVFLFETLTCLLGLQGTIHVPLIVEVEDGPRTRPRVVLSEHTTNALRQLFDEWCAPNAMGMGQREIEGYLQKCGIDSIPTQKILDIMAKYPIASGNGKGTNTLSLDGFLAYYQDTAQTNELRVRLDLHTHGFRPDLTRRPLQTRIVSHQGRDHTLTTAESIAMDVARSIAETAPSLGALADLGLFTFSLYSTAYNASEALAEHMLSAAFYNKNTDRLVVDTLKAIYTAPTGWVGNETLNSAILILRVLAAIPDGRQGDRIDMMMQCREGQAPHLENGIGLLPAARAFYQARQSHAYPTEMSYAFERYVGVLKDLLGLQSIFIWMTENRSLWSWMERDLLDTHHPSPVQGQVRNDYSGRREGDMPGVPGDHQQSDSEGMPGINDSEEDDDDSRYEEMDTYSHGPAQVIIDGAGNPAVNGVYSRDGFFERASKFSRRGEYGGKQCLFSIFQCNVSNNTKHWYISIVPGKGPPGTNADTDFYSAPVTETCIELPPLSGWTKANDGQDPPPTLTFKDSASDGAGNGGPGPQHLNEQNGGPSYV